MPEVIDLGGGVFERRYMTSSSKSNSLATVIFDVNFLSTMGLGENGWSGGGGGQGWYYSAAPGSNGGVIAFQVNSKMSQVFTEPALVSFDKVIVETLVRMGGGSRLAILPTTNTINGGSTQPAGLLYIADTDWHNVKMVFDRVNTQVTIYVDEVEVSSVADIFTSAQYNWFVIDNNTVLGNGYIHMADLKISGV